MSENTKEIDESGVADIVTAPFGKAALDVSTRKPIVLKRNAATIAICVPFRSQFMRTLYAIHLVPITVLSVGMLMISACAVVETGEQPASTEPAAQASPERTVIALTSISSSQAPVLALLTRDFAVVQGHELLDEGQAQELEPAALLDGARAIIADMAQIQRQDVDGYRQLLDAASRRGVPMVLENIRDPDLMAAIIGFGVRSEVAVIRPSNRGDTFTITMFGDTGATEPVLEKSVPEADAHMAEPEPAPTQGPPPTPVETAAQIATHLNRSTVQSLTLGNYPAGTYKDYYFNVANGTFWGNNNPDESLDVGFHVELVAASSPSGKFMIVSTTGAGASAGGLLFNSSTDRGWFTESAQIKIATSSSGLSVVDFAPASQNNTTSYEVTNGCSFGGGISVGSGGPTLGLSFECESSNSESMSFPDFSVDSQVNGTTGTWKFYMSAASGLPNHDYSGLMDSPSTLKALPSLATSTLRLPVEVVYRADSAFVNTVNLYLEATHRVNYVWIREKTTFVPWLSPLVEYIPFHMSFPYSKGSNVSVDFSRVSLSEVYTPLAIVGSGLAMTVLGASSSNGANVVQEARTNDGNDANDDHRLFQLVLASSGNGSYYIKPRHSKSSDMCLDISGASTAVGAQVIQWPCSGTGNQRFKFISADSNSSTYWIKNEYSNLCLGVTNGNGGTNVTQQQCLDQEKQRFRTTY
ncbi:RICIN domain-containing protein [Sorangium sp. So ce1128]